MILSHPLAQSVLAPLLASLALLFVSRATLGGRLAGVALGAGLLATLALMAGGFDWPPRGALQKLPWAMTMLLAAGIALELARVGGRRLAAAATLLLAAATAWMASTRFANDSIETAIDIAAMAVVAALLTWRFSSTREAATLPALMLAMAAAGLAAVVFNGGSLAIAQAGIGLAVACAALAAVSLFTATLCFGATALVAGLGAWVLLATATILLTETSRFALVALLPVFFCDLPVHWLRRGDSTPLTCLWVALAGLPPLLLAVVLAFVLVPEQSLYY